ncbi:MAG TPA: hypothetical protein VFP87_00690, partial [Chitinophagaceae bacterium]|nr:hypothetical protein [Chitinophagaceae bacterium]
MRSEYLDKKVQEAAEKHHPAYDEKAWQKMEKLLNQHLPVQRDDDRRRFFLLLFFFLLLGGGAYVLISKPWDTDTEIASRSNANNEKVLDKSNSTPNDKSANEGQSINANAVDAIPPFAKDVATTQSIKISSRENRREKSVIPGVPPGLINRGEKNEVSKNQVDKRNLSVTNDETITTPELSREIKPDQRPIDSKKVTDNNQNLLNNAVTKQTESISKQETPKIETSNVQVQQTATKPPI